jgi:hypothetical protein
MEQRRLEFVLEARQPIAHAEGNYGNTSVIMRDKVRTADGQWASVPIITGDTMRHGIREAAALCLLECAGMLGNTLSEGALRLLFSGGMVTSTGGVINLEDYRKMIDLVPSLALLGGCAGNRIIPGRINVSNALLICQETHHLLPTWVQQWMADKYWEYKPQRSHVEEVQRVRMDPCLDPGKRALLSPEARAAAEGRMLASEAASASEDFAGVERSKSTMLPFRYERVARGSLFFWSVSATCYSALDHDTLLVMVGAFLRNAVVGGKRGTGHGLLHPLAANNVTLANFSERMDTLDLADPSARVGRLFQAHIQERAEAVRELLGKVVA